jgi:hypothetical protein
MAASEFSGVITITRIASFTVDRLLPCLGRFTPPRLLLVLLLVGSLGVERVITSTGDLLQVARVK